MLTVQALDPCHHREAQQGRERQILEAHWLASLAETVGSGFSERTCSKQGREQLKKILQYWPLSPHVCAQVNTQSDTDTCYKLYFILAEVGSH